jgi:hypothetical protein
LGSVGQDATADLADDRDLVGGNGNEELLEVGTLVLAVPMG